MFDDETGPYQVVVNHLGQMSIWPEGREQAPGWSPEGFVGTRQEALDHIESVWTDIRPRH